MPRITDKSFVYVPAVKTDIRKTFKRIREQQKREREARPQSVVPMRKAAK